MTDRRRLEEYVLTSSEIEGSAPVPKATHFVQGKSQGWKKNIFWDRLGPVHGNFVVLNPMEEIRKFGENCSKHELTAELSCSSG
jgi:hypothetical protein